MTNAFVPKVTLEESTSPGGVPRGNQVVVGAIGVSASGTANTLYRITSVSQAISIFGANTSESAVLVKMIKRLFQEGATVVKAISIGQPTLDADTSGSEGLLTADAEAGQAVIAVADADDYEAGNIVYLGTSEAYDKEERLVVASINSGANTVTFTTNLEFKHYTGENARIVTPKSSSDYSTAITLMETDEDKSIVICDFNDDTTAGLLKTMCENSAANYNTPCVYIRPPHYGENLAAVQTNATTHNSNRVICCWPLLTDFIGLALSPGETAAVLAGAIAGNGIPKLNHNFTSFEGVGGVEAAITDMDAVISSGITPIELKNDSIHIVRFVTSKTETDNVPDLQWQEAAVRLNVDNIQKTLSRVIQQKYMQKGNTPETRTALAQEVVSVLEAYASQSILVGDETRNIPAYRQPVVSVDADDSTKVNVEVEISPGKPLNFINLQFKVIL